MSHRSFSQNQSSSISEASLKMGGEKKLLIQLRAACNVGQEMKVDINAKKLKTILDSLQIYLTDRQIHQAWIYSASHFTPLKPPIPFHTQSLNLFMLAKWIIKRNQNSRSKTSIKMPKTPMKTQPDSNQSTSPIRLLSLQKKIKNKKLPYLSKPKEVFNQSIDEALEILLEMKRLRQEYGLVPIDLKKQNPQQESQQQQTNIPYAPQMHELNKHLQELRMKVERKIDKVKDICTKNGSLRKKFETCIEKEYKRRLLVNEKMGRFGSMKAHKRMIEKNKKQLEHYNSLVPKSHQNKYRVNPRRFESYYSEDIDS